MTYPGAIIFPAHITNTLGPPNIPKGFVLHTPEEPADGYPGTPHWFAEPHPDTPGSTTWFIATNGDVYECVDEGIAAIANGVIGKPYPVWADPNRSLNRQTVSVEIEGYAATIAQTLTEAQRRSLISLIQYASKKYGFPIDRSHIIGHYEVANNRSDPGTLHIDAIIAAAQEDDMDADEKAAFRRYFIDPHGEGAYNTRYPGRENWTRADVIFEGVAYLDAQHIGQLFNEHKAIQTAIEAQAGGVDVTKIRLSMEP